MNNPLKFIDPDGKEVINGFHESDSINYAAAKYFRKYNDDDTIHIFGHGTANLLLLRDKNGKRKLIEKGGDLLDFLYENSETWLNLKEGDPLVIVLYTCRPASDMTENNIADQIAADDELKSIKQIFDEIVDFKTMDIGHIYY